MDHDKEYKHSAFTTDEKYNGKIRTYQNEIQLFTQIVYVMNFKLNPHSIKELPDIFSIKCKMQPSKRQYLTQLKKGDNVYIISKVVGMEVLDIKLEDCLIARVPKKE